MESTTVQIPKAGALPQQLGAEALGTFALVLLGCGTAVATGADVVATGLAFGITVLVMALVLGRVSGGHFNPAVSVGAAVSGRFAWKDVPAYVAAQLAGSLAAALVLFVVLQGVGVQGFTTHGNMGQNGFGDYSATHLHWWAAFLVELLLTAVFVFVILGVTDERNPLQGMAPVAIGLTLAAIHFMAIPLTGTSVNPARSIGPALFSGAGHVAQLWLFILAPLLGALAAGTAYPAVLGRSSEPVPGSGMIRTTTPGGSDAVGASGPGEDPEAHLADDTVRRQTWPPERIVQDGWEWDYQAQQWKPLEAPSPE